MPGFAAAINKLFFIKGTSEVGRMGSGGTRKSHVIFLFKKNCILINTVSTDTTFVSDILIQCKAKIKSNYRE